MRGPRAAPVFTSCSVSTSVMSAGRIAEVTRSSLEPMPHRRLDFSTRRLSWRANMARQASIFDRIGGRPVLERVLRSFYDKAFAHPWLGSFFVGIDREELERQAADFLSQALGGPRVFRGVFPKLAHQHLFITEELWDLRLEVLAETLRDCGLDEEAAGDWLTLEGAFAGVVVKERVEDCEKRFPDDRILEVRKPR